MYITRPLSHYLNNPEDLSLPPEGPNSGYLVIQDEESEIFCCFGLWKDWDLVDLPFPQNKNLTTRYYSSRSRHNQYTGTHHRKEQHTSYHDVTFFPVLNQPLSSNRYYAIKPHGKHKGKAYASSPFDPSDTHQQFEIANYETACNEGGGFYAKSVAQDSFPPHFLRRKGWKINTKTPKNYTLGEAVGLNSTLRARLPDLSSKAVVIGKWYCPFMFIKDGALTSRDQMTNSMFYEMTLEQRWEQIFECNNMNHGNVVMVDAVVQREVIFVGDREGEPDNKNVVHNIIEFKSSGSKGEEVSIGLSSQIFERMKWEEQRAGWVDGGESEVRVKRVEEFGGSVEGWRKFGCYVLVESFVLKRMDGSLVMTYDFKHTQQLKCLWM
ncbi:hypothetical protein ACET3Z_024810 [Daucus carota]